MTPPSDRRERILQVRLSEAEWADLQREADLDVLDVSSWVRSIAIKEARQRDIERKVPRQPPQVKILPRSTANGSNGVVIPRSRNRR